MLTRREFLEVAAATAAVTGLGGGLGSAAAQQRIGEADLLRFEAKGQVTLLHIADCHAQLHPLYHREPSVNLGVGDMLGAPPHVTGEAFLTHYGIAPGSLAAYTLAAGDYERLARSYGRVGGMDRLATLIKAIRAERGADRTLLLDGGDSLHGSYTALKSQGADMVAVLTALGVEAMTGHWEFTLGFDRMTDLFGDRYGPGTVPIPFLAVNVVEADFEEPAFAAMRFFEKGGIWIAVIGQAFPYTPIAHPRHLMPKWSFGIRENRIRRYVARARAAGADLVVLLSHNGFDVDRKLAGRVAGIDVILSAHTHDALPAPARVGNTLIVASGSHGKFLSRLDLEVKGGRVADYGYALIPVLSDAIAPDPAVTRLIDEAREPYEAMLSTELARTETLLYRRDTFNGTLDDVICQAMLRRRDTEICFSPGFRWGATLLPGQAVTWEDVYDATAITYPACYRQVMSGVQIHAILEDVADNLFNPDPYYQQGGDMVRVGGLGFSIDVDQAIGRRITDLTLLRTGERLDPVKDYAVAGWASVNPAVEGPAIWDVVADHLRDQKTVRVPPNGSIKVAP
jgi:sulfur-oxidizing protein SoxB